MKTLYKCFLISSILLLISGLMLSVVSVLSPIADFPRQHLSHQHGIWWDCIVHHNTLIPLYEVQAEQRGDRCESKLDPAIQNALRVALEKGDEQAKELLLHRFLPHHKGVIFFVVFTLVFGALAVVIGSCSPCFPPNALLYVVSIFMTCSCSILADVIFLFAFNKSLVESSEPSEDQEPSIEKRIGIATYIHVLGSSLLFLSFVFSLFSAYFLLTSTEAHDVCCSNRKEYMEERRWRNSGIILKTSSGPVSRPFVVVDDDSSM